MQNFKLIAKSDLLAKALTTSADVFSLTECTQDKRVIKFNANRKTIKAIKIALQGYGTLEPIKANTNQDNTSDRIKQLEIELATLRASVAPTKAPTKKVIKAKKAKATKKASEFVKVNLDVVHTDGIYNIAFNKANNNHVLFKGTDVFGAYGNLELAIKDIAIDKTRG